MNNNSAEKISKTATKILIGLILIGIILGIIYVSSIFIGIFLLLSG